VPALVLVGDADQMTPPQAGFALAARIPGARVVRLPACGHSMLSEQPNQVLDALIDIL
jgi:pimeloyl-ACP methyl ester carboxylesterase